MPELTIKQLQVKALTQNYPPIQESIDAIEAQIEALSEEPCTLFTDPFDGGTITAHGSSYDFECGPHGFAGELGQQVEELKEDMAHLNELGVHEVFWAELPEPKQEDEDEDLPW